MSKLEEEHARLMLGNEIGVAFDHYDDGSGPHMPDLVSVDGRHVAEVITTVPPAVREAERNLDSTPEAKLPHCVWVTFPYSILGGATKEVRHKIKADVLRWIDEAGCDNHWSSQDDHLMDSGTRSFPFRALASCDDGVQVLCAQLCQHPVTEPHEIKWPVMHSPSVVDPWTLVRQSLQIVDEEQRGGVTALANKLRDYPNKHLVMYPFGPPGNVTASINQFMPSDDPRDFARPVLSHPLSDVHIWLPYQYGDRNALEGLHIWNGGWRRFGTTLPSADLSALFRARSTGRPDSED